MILTDLQAHQVEDTGNIVITIVVIKYCIIIIIDLVQVDLGEWVELTMAAVAPPLLQWAGVDEEGIVI